MTLRYIVEIRHRSGNYLAEIDFDRADRGTVLDDLLAGQYEGAVHVYRLEDATSEFAQAVSARCAEDGEDIPPWLSELVENGTEPWRARASDTRALGESSEHLDDAAAS